MTPFWKSLAYLLYGLIGVVVPFLLGRWSRSTRYCQTCERQRALANRARLNGESVASVARLRQRATSPDDVRRQADEDRRFRHHLTQVGELTDTQLRGIRL